MQKLIGCILILLSTTAGGFLYGVEQQQYLEKLMYIRHILELIQGEIEYSGAPLFEVFWKNCKPGAGALSQLDAGSPKKGGGKRRAEFSGDLGGVHGNKIKGASS